MEQKLNNLVKKWVKNGQKPVPEVAAARRVKTALMLENFFKIWPLNDMIFYYYYFIGMIRLLAYLVRVAPDCNCSYCEDSFSGHSGSV